MNDLTSLTNRRQYGYRMTLCFVFFVSFCGCAGYRWTAHPISEIDVQKEVTPSRVVYFETDLGKIGLQVQSFADPYILGKVTLAGGRAGYNLLNASTIEIGTLDNSKRFKVSSTHFYRDIQLDPQKLDGKAIRVTSESRERLTLADVHPLTMPWVEGQLIEGNGYVRIDLKNVHAIEIGIKDEGKTVLLTLGGILLVASVIFLIIAVDFSREWEGI